jgi:phosphomannomutase
MDLMSETNNERDEQLPSIERTSYTCPGESYSIPRSIHLARMAAFYPKCRDCEHRLDTARILTREVGPQTEPDRRATRASLLTDENVRGIYLNELDRNRALLWGEALAAYLWDQHPMTARQTDIDQCQIIAEKSDGRGPAASRGPTVVVGFDERPSSPDIARGVVLGLRRMGCPVIDLGQTAFTALAFHIHSHAAAAGLFVTGAGCDPAWTGFNYLGRGAMPFPHGGLLQLERDVASGVGRQTRQIGTHVAVQGQSAYESSLIPHFHALRPLRIVCGTSTRFLPRVLDRLFAGLPCQLTHIALATRRRDLFNVGDVDLRRVAAAVAEGNQHVGVIIDDDGLHAAFVTDRGRLATPHEIARLLIEIAQRENPAAQFVVSTSWMKETARWLSGRDATAIDGGETTEDLVKTLADKSAVLALSSDGRVWFRQSYPVCDALLVVAHVLQALSLSDALFSDVVSRISQNAEGPH